MKTTFLEKLFYKHKNFEGFANFIEKFFMKTFKKIF